MTSHLREGREPATVTEREATERERAAFLKGREMVSRSGACAHTITPYCMTCEADAKRMYPLPKISRPLRGEFSDGTVAWWAAGIQMLQYRPVGCSIRNLHGAGVQFFAERYLKTPDDVKLLARMLSGEMELVEADAAPSTVRGPTND